MFRATVQTRRVCPPLIAAVLAASLLLVIALVVTATAHATTSLISTGDGTWVWQRPLPQGNDLNDIAFADDLRGWAVGNAGTILRSVDGGATWTGDRSSVDADLRGIGVADAQTAWAVGASGTILATADGGAKWRPQQSGVDTELRAVAAVSPTRVWVAGDDGIVVHTTDGGATWDRQTTACLADLHAIEFVTASDGWVSGAEGVLLHTADGGATWSLQDWAGPSGYPSDRASQVALRALTFVDDRSGWAIGGFDVPWHGAVFVHTTDGGFTWTAMPRVIDFAHVSDVQFTDRLNGWVVTQGAYSEPSITVEVSRTSDGGRSWSGTWFPHVMRFDEHDQPFPVSLAVDDHRQAWVAGPLGRISRTLDGMSWASAVGSLGGWFEDIDFADSSRGWAVGWQSEYSYGFWGTVLATTDAGRTWSRSGPDDCGPLRAVASRGATVVAVGHTNGYSPEHFSDEVAYSRDSGVTWATVDAGPGLLNDVDLVSPDRGWAVGTFMAVRRTDDGGASWVDQSPAGSAAHFQAVDFVDDDHGWIVGTSGVVMHSSDGGSTWQAQSSGTSSTLNDVAFTDRSSGWTVGDGGVALHTADGGRTWAPIATGAGIDLSEVRTAGDTVRIVGGGGTIVVSRDAGLTWRTESAGVRADLEGLAMVPTGEAWVVGRKGEILATDGGEGDTTPPSTTDDAVRGWANHDVTVTLSASDAGSGVARSEYRLDGGSWTVGSEVLVAAPSDHSGDGVHAIAYRSVDVAGNVEDVHDCEVGIDTKAPAITAPRLTLVRYGRMATLICVASDPSPSGGKVVVSASGSRTNRRRSWTVRATTVVGEVARLELPDDLERGSYRVHLLGRDAAGNTAAPVTVQLVVR